MTEGSEVFIQADGEIMCKALSRGESLVVNFWCLVAFESSCGVCLRSQRQIPFDTQGAVVATVQGPGKVYLCPHGREPRVAGRKGGGEPSALSAWMEAVLRLLRAWGIFFVIYVVICGVVAYMTMDEETVTAIEEFIQRMEAIRRHNNRDL